MRLITILLDGLAGRPLPGLVHGTALATAKAPGLAALASDGRSGWLDLPRGFADVYRPEALLAALAGWPASDALGFRRGPLEALAAGLPASGSADRAWSGALVTLDEDGLVVESQAPALSETETGLLVEAMNPGLAGLGGEMRTTGPGRVVVVGPAAESAAPDPGPVRIGDLLPEGRGRDRFARHLNEAVRPALEAHSVNQIRIDLSENPVHGVWLWGGGSRKAVSEVAGRKLAEERVAVVTNSPLGRGLAECRGWPVIELATPWEGRLSGHPFRVPALVEAMRKARHLVVWVEAPRDGGDYGAPEDKVWAVERLDQHVLRPLADLARAHRPCRLLVAAGGPAGAGDPPRLPVLVAGDGVLADRVTHFDEAAVEQGALGRTDLERLLNFAWDR